MYTDQVSLLAPGTKLKWQSHNAPNAAKTAVRPLANVRIAATSKQLLAVS